MLTGSYSGLDRALSSAKATARGGLIRYLPLIMSFNRRLPAPSLRQQDFYCCLMLGGCVLGISRQDCHFLDNELVLLVAIFGRVRWVLFCSIGSLVLKRQLSEAWAAI